MKVVVELDDDEVAALRRFCVEEHMGGRGAAKMLIRDALIGLGLLHLGKANRSRFANGGRR